MARLFLRILLISLLPFALRAWELKKLDKCPANKVCVVGGSDICKVNGVEAIPDMRIYFYEDDSSCKDAAWGKSFYMRMDFEPRTPRNWTFVLTFWDRHPDDSYKTIDNQHLDNIGFKFPLAKLTFPNESNVQFEWQKDNATEWEVSLYELKKYKEGGFKSCIDSSTCWYYKRVQFSIDSEEKLARFFAVPKWSFMRLQDNMKNMDLYDSRYLEKMNKLVPCDEAEFKQACYGTCERMDMTNSTNVANCSSSLWFHPTAEATFTRRWKPADEVKCRLGNWTALWKDGSQELDASFEVQCAPEMPGKFTGTMIALMTGGGILLVVAVVVIVYLIYRSRRAPADSRRGTTRSQSNAETPGSSKKSTPGIYMIPPEPQEPAGADAAFPPLPPAQRSNYVK